MPAVARAAAVGGCGVPGPRPAARAGGTLSR